jgi:hypothetical protein
MRTTASGERSNESYRTVEEKSAQEGLDSGLVAVILFVIREALMALRTVRLDEDSEKILKELMMETGKSISAVLKEGLLALLDRQTSMAPRRTAWEIYEELDLGLGGYAIAPSTEVRRGVREAIRRKLGR